MDPKLYDAIIAALRRKEQARAIALRLTGASEGSTGAIPPEQVKLGWSQCVTHPNHPKFKYDCEEQAFTCANQFTCTVMFYDCTKFSCGGPRTAFLCTTVHTGGQNEGRDFVCATDYRCVSSFICSRDHGYYCFSRDICGTNFSCNNKDGVKDCNGTDLNTYNAPYNNGKSGDFQCGIDVPEAVPARGFSCSMNFSCTTKDQFLCTPTKAESSRFECMEVEEGAAFSCKPTETSFLCVVPGVSKDKFSYTCAGGFLEGGYGPHEH